MVVPNLIEIPGALNGGGGGLQVAVFSMTHVSGTFSTGALGFTPRVAVYSGAVRGPLAEADVFSHIVGFAIGTGALARAAGVAVDTVTPGNNDTGGDDDSIGGSVPAAGAFQTAFSIDLDVTAFAASGIDLAWSGTVQAHAGKLVVIGDLSGGGGGGEVLGFLAVAVNTALAAADVHKVVLATAGAGGITVTLPDPTLAAVVGRPIYIKKVDAAVGLVTVDSFGAETIDGAASVTIGSQYQTIKVVSDGTNWHII